MAAHSAASTSHRALAPAHRRVRTRRRATQTAQPSPPPRVVARCRGRGRPHRRAGVAALFVVLLGAVVFHTQLAERQLRDRPPRARGRRSSASGSTCCATQRAELRSPTRLADAAGALGMVPAPSEFVAVDARGASLASSPPPGALDEHVAR